MTLTLSHVQPELIDLVGGVRGVLDMRADWQRTAIGVADQLRQHLPGPEVLGSGAAGHPESRTLYVEPDGSFSIMGLAWRPGQVTRIHDHITWCAFGVVQGIEHEEVFDGQLNLVSHNYNYPGQVSGFAPPGDIHRIHNTGTGTAISIHIYGTDISRVGSSVRRYYDLSAAITNPAIGNVI
jgi:3-mercaptopropionate dioxygenase